MSTLEVVMPCLQQFAFIIHHNPLDPSQFRGAKPNISLQPNGIQPELRHAALSFDMDVRWFASVARIEE
jgi:hypothetical protein